MREALSEPSADVRSWSALVLGEIADPQTTAALERLKNDPDTNVRANAALAVTRINKAKGK